MGDVLRIRESLPGEMTQNDIEALAERLERHSAQGTFLLPQTRSDLKLAAARLRFDSAKTCENCGTPAGSPRSGVRDDLANLLGQSGKPLRP